MIVHAPSAWIYDDSDSDEELYYQPRPQAFALGAHAVVSPTSPPKQPQAQLPAGWSHTPQTLPIDGRDPEDLLFRVHDAKFASPLTADGFTATSSQFRPDGQPLSGTKWRAQFNNLYFSRDFRKSDTTREAIIKHVLGGWPGYTGKGFTGPSNWISTTESFDWAVWEITRRLVVLRRPSVGLSLLDRTIYYPRGYKGNRCIVEDAEEAINAYGKDYWLDPDQTTARNYSRSSSEMVYLGRIFHKDILETEWWTAKSPPYSWNAPFMESFFKPKGHRRGGSWLDWLVFDPKGPFSAAAKKMDERREQLRTSRRVYYDSD